MIIYFAEEELCSEHLIEIMKKSAEYCLEAEGLDSEACEISVSFVSKNRIRELNRAYRGIDKVTDVLSFPQYEAKKYMTGPLIELGDVVVCKERAEEQSETFGHSFERELLYLFVHSMLHLLGYDHMEDDDKKEMRVKEEEIMKYLNLGR